jgi:hypothetical protein
VRFTFGSLIAGTELTADFWTIRYTAGGYRATPVPTSLERTPWNLESASTFREPTLEPSARLTSAILESAPGA